MILQVGLLGGVVVVVFNALSAVLSDRFDRRSDHSRTYSVDYRHDSGEHRDWGFWGFWPWHHWDHSFYGEHRS